MIESILQHDMQMLRFLVLVGWTNSNRKKYDGEKVECMANDPHFRRNKKIQNIFGTPAKGTSIRLKMPREGWVSSARPPKSHLESVELLDLFGKNRGILLGSYLDRNWFLIAIRIILHGSSKWKAWIPSLYHRPKQCTEWKRFKMTVHNCIKRGGWHLIIPKKTYVLHPFRTSFSPVGFTDSSMLTMAEQTSTFSVNESRSFLEKREGISSQIDP